MRRQRIRKVPLVPFGDGTMQLVALGIEHETIGNLLGDNAAEWLARIAAEHGVTTFADRNRAARRVSNLGFAFTNFLYVVGYAVGLGLGAYLYLRGEVSIGAAYLIVYYIGMLTQPLHAIRRQVETLQQAGASIARVGELFALQPGVRPPASPQ